MRLGDLDALKEAIETYDKFACLTDTRLVPFHRISGHEEDYEPYVKLRDIRNAIDNAPTVPLPDFKEGYKQAIIDGKTNFSRPQGEWSFDSEFLLVGCPYGSYKCSNCGIHTDDKEDNFCWNCGADMRGGGAE